MGNAKVHTTNEFNAQESDLCTLIHDVATATMKHL